MNAERDWAVRLLVDGAEPIGTPVTGFVVRASRYARCDTAEIELAVDRLALGGDGVWFDPVVSARMDVRLQLCRRDETASRWVTIFQGLADYVDWSPDMFRATIECRDYLSLLLDARVQESWLNQTGGELVSTLVQSVGLQADIAFGDVANAAAGMTGQFWQIEHKRSSALAQHRFQTAFDLAFFLAREAGCDLYAQGQSIIGGPMLAADDVEAVVHDVSGALLSRSCRQDLTMQGGVVVHVASWDSRQRSRTEIYYDGQSFTAQAPSSGLVHSFRVPGRRSDDVKSVALGKYNRIMAHQREVRVRIPGRAALKPRHFLRAGAVPGGVTNDWTKALSVDAVVSKGSVTGGFVQDVILRDRSGGVTE